MQQLKVFISSTYFDLSQIRSDLFDFFTGLGYSPILSEYSSFPVDPDNDTIKNCIENVKTTDLFVLIIGSRYGYVMDSGKSITNTEYLYAKETGIPVYVFIAKTLINILPVWKKNKSGDFSGIVDSVKVFEFAEEVMEKNKTWCFEFERAQDIVLRLRIQLSHLFQHALDLRKRYNVPDQPEFYKDLSAKALNIIFKKELLYEARFFIQVLKDELVKHEYIKLDFEYKILTNCTREIESKEVLVGWLNVNFASILHQVASLNKLFATFTKYYGAPGIPADLKGLYYVARAIAKIFKEMALWALDIKSTKVGARYENIKEILSDFPTMTLKRLWEYPDTVIADIDEGIKRYEEDNNQKITIEGVLVLEVDEMLVKRFNAEMRRIT